MKRSFFIGIICIAVAALITLVVVAGISIAPQPEVFRDVTVEIGSDPLSIWDFLTDPPRREGSAFVSDVTKIDLNTVGVTPITMRHKNKLYTVNLTVQDSIAPEVTFVKECVLPLGQTPQVQDFIESIEDATPVTVEFITAPKSTDTYSDQTVEVAVTDAGGNRTTGVCTLRYDWIKTDVVIEYGTQLTRADILVDPVKDADLISQDALNEINLGGIGKYTITVQSGSSIRNCSITIQDTLPPELKLKVVSLYPTQICDQKAFIESVSDPSGDVTLELLSELPFGQEGNHTIQFKATDRHGNSCTAQTLLRIHTDIIPPSIFGLIDIQLTANTAEVPDYAKNVYGKDATDGIVEVFYDASQVDLTTPGIYYVNYTATDNTGNEAIKKRKVIVLPDYTDTARLVEDIAKNLTATDPESLRDYVRDNIVYLGPAWGGDDPVGYGFTKWRGNCKVHAECLKALLDYFGYENEIIYLMPQYNPHYWNLIKIDGVWYHIDSTPADSHQRYSLMNNQQRLATLKGRRWDVDKWPQIKEEEQ